MNPRGPLTPPARLKVASASLPQPVLLWSAWLLFHSLLLLFLPSASWADSVPDVQNCEFNYSLLINRGIDSPTIQKWLDWEISPTVKGWDQESASAKAPVAFIRGDSVEVESLGAKDLVGLERFLDTSSDSFPWLKHPYNTSKEVPNLTAPSSLAIKTHQTASRTVVMNLDGRIVSVKMPTNHPFGPSRAAQEGKIKMDADLKYSVARSKAIEFIDDKVGTDPSFIALKELAAVIDKKTRNGYLFRDLTPLQDGNYYLPGHQLPYIGKKISARMGEDFTKFWTEHWAAEIGRYQAKLLYRYGIEVRAVNPQNFLVQLDSQMKPTGTIVWRDLAESHLVKPVASQIGLQDFVDRDMRNGGWGIRSKLELDRSNLAWRFNDTTKTLSGDELKVWQKAHDLAYRQELENALKIQIPSKDDLSLFLNYDLGKKPEGSLVIQGILKWHENMKKKKGASTTLLWDGAAPQGHRQQHHFRRRYRLAWQNKTSGVARTQVRAPKKLFLLGSGFGSYVVHHLF